MASSITVRKRGCCSSLLLYLVILSCTIIWTQANEIGGIIRDFKVYSKTGTAYEVTSDITVVRGGQLTIEPGVILRFRPGTGLIVQGTINAQGTQAEPIVFTKQGAGTEYQNSWSTPTQRQDLRLVDGTTTLEGRLQLFYKKKWYSVCTNSKNWTQTDIDVTCQELGFVGGSLYKWFERSNDTRQLLLEHPNCNGTENALSECFNWQKKQVGSGVCDYHQDIGIKCDSTLKEGSKLWGNWRGISFLHAEYVETHSPFAATVNRRVSKSKLENVSIQYGGVDPEGRVFPSLFVVGLPPNLTNIEVKWSAYTGANFSDQNHAFEIFGGQIADNSGHGMFVNTSTGEVSLKNVSVSNNDGDGIHYVYHKAELLVSANRFCSSPDLDDKQIYPHRLTHNQLRTITDLKSCTRTFKAIRGQTLTLHFPVLVSDTEPHGNSGFLTVYDGPSVSSIILGRIPILNNTAPQSVSSSRESLTVQYDKPWNQTLLFTVELISTIGKAYDLNITDCKVENNNGRGVYVLNQRSGIVVNRTTISGSHHVAGLQLHQGAGDVILNNSFVVDNKVDGVNITLAGGLKHFDRTTIARNERRGVAIWYNETSESMAFNFSSHISYCTVHENGLQGFLIGNLCRSDSFWNVSMNTFYKNHDIAFQIESCWQTLNPKQVTLQIKNNRFQQSNHLAIRLIPIMNINALIEHNKFSEHNRGVMIISNREIMSLNLPENEWSSTFGVGALDQRDVSNKSTSLLIQFNEFLLNKGSFVVDLGLLEGSLIQELIFTRNRLHDNAVQEAYPGLRPRSRVAAVVVVESTNVIVYRNYFVNPESAYELGVHLEQHNIAVNATMNHWGITKGRDAIAVYEKIFDRKDRFNLARVEFKQYITSSTDLETLTEISEVENKDVVMQFRDGKNIGGEVTGRVVLETNIYNVYRDIYVHPKSELIISSGTILNFGQSLGMMVQGKLESKGTDISRIRYTVGGSVGPGIGNVPVRLSNGTEGRLEVKTTDGWSSVCLYNWDIQDAAIVCQQLGLILNTKDWLLERSQFPSNENGDNIALSDVQCSEIDTDILQCRAQTLDDFENSCPFEVGMKCFPPTWAGIRLGMQAERSTIEHSIIEKAGVVDYSTHHFRPALQLDFNRHDIRNVVIQDSSDSGLGIMWNDLFSRNENLEISNGEFTSNKLHGVVTRSQGVDLIRAKFLDNMGSGMHYDPMFTRDEQRDLLSWVNFQNKENVITIPTDLGTKKYIEIGQGESKYMIFRPPDTRPFDFQFKTNSGWNLGFLVLSPFTRKSTENLSIFGRLESKYEAPEWDLRKNLTSFPLRNLGFGVTFQYEPGTAPDGSLVLYVSSVEKNRNKKTEEFVPTIQLIDSTITKCGRGFSSNHYNRQLSHEGDIYHRYANETVLIINTMFKEMYQDAIYVSTPFWDPDQTNLAEINYTLIRNEITGCYGGIVQYTRDIRNSNNIYHWTINQTKAEYNLHGGIKISLPYVWQYSENYTHSVCVHKNIFQDNKIFELSIGGHFAKVNMSGNHLKRNLCKTGVLDIWGMEKEILIEDNFFEQNTGEFVVLFNIQSHTEKFGLVPATFKRNVLRDNRDSAVRIILEPNLPSSCGLSIQGVQLVNITRNVFENPNMQLELLAGVLTGTLANKINVASNWWGSTNITVIQKKIFDFDDWNSYAIANFIPYLGRDSVDAGSIPDQLELHPINVDEPFGGRLRSSLTLKRRSRPYVIKTDLTVMPGQTLTLEEGTEIEFYPSIGILVLGELIAKGQYNRPIAFRPLKKKESFRIRRDTKQQPLVRLCVDEACNENRRDGFLEIFNTTTLQWAPVCDPRFSERNAEVACYEMGYNRYHVSYRRGPRWDLGTNQLSRIRSWPHPLACNGREASISDCDYRLNGYSDRYYACSYPGDFVYVYCGHKNREGLDHFWGGIRFSIPNFELRNEDFHLTTHSYFRQPISILQYVNVEGAGMLHGEKNSAIQMVMREVMMNNINIRDCASHGLEVIAPPSNIYFNSLEIENNLGVGVNILVLSGDASDEVATTFPLRQVDLPYKTFGMVDICDTKKELPIQERVLLYFKYDYTPADCVKIFYSVHDVKEIGFRLLQVNLFNSSGVSSQPDLLRIYDGNIFNESIPILSTITMGKNTEQEGRIQASYYKSSMDTLSVQLHVSGGSGVYGFIAEVVTLPVNYANSRDLRHNITNSIIRNNEQGGIAYRSAGESTPMLTVAFSRFDNNGKSLFGNFTTSDSAILVDVQNEQHILFKNNLLSQNQGGLHIYADSQNSVASLNGLIVNNLFVENENREALLVSGLFRVGQFQRMSMTRNYFVRNYALYKDTISLNQVISYFSQNLLVNNTGKHIIDIFGFEKVSLSYQTCNENWFTSNKATMFMERSTVYASSAGQRYFHNYFNNPDNDFEIATANRSHRAYNFDIKQGVVNASYNWWGFNESSAISGRIRDWRDHQELLEVQFTPFYFDNTTVLSGKCSGGWQQIGETCFLYVGGLVTHQEAKRFCENDNASLPYTKKHHIEDLQHFLGRQQENYDRDYLKVWVQSIDVAPSECAILYDGHVTGQRCDDNLPFLCEKDPLIFVSNIYWYKEPLSIAALSVVGITLFFVALCMGCWLCKSRVKYQEKLERRNSIRASIRSNSMGSFGELGYKRRLERDLKIPTKGTNFKLNESIDSMEKTPQSQMSASVDASQLSFDILETRNSHIGFGGTFTDRFSTDPQLENANVDALVRPTFDLTYENRGYIDRAVSRASGDRISPEWESTSGSTTGSTLDMKRALADTSRDADSRDTFAGSPTSHTSYTNGSAKGAPLETAM